MNPPARRWHSFIFLALTASLLSLYCADDDSPVEPEPVSPGAPIDSFKVPVFANQWETRLENGDLIWPGTSTVTLEGTLLVTGFGKLYEYDIFGRMVGNWPIVVDDDTLTVVHIRTKYENYYAYARSHSEEIRDRLLVLDSSRNLIRNTPIARPPNSTVSFASLDVDMAGNVYQLSFYEELVIKSGPSGAYEREWLTHGSNPTDHNWPGGIVVTPTGTVYVSDTIHHRILVFDSNGLLLNEWGSEGEGPGQFGWPTALESDQWGLLYVLDRLNDRVQKFAPDGTYLGEFQSYIPAVDHDTSPIGLAVGDKNAFVIHAQNLIRRFHFYR